MDLNQLTFEELDKLQESLRKQRDHKLALIKKYQEEIDSTPTPIKKPYVGPPISISKISEFWTRDIKSIVWIDAWKPCFICGALPKLNMFGKLEKMLEVKDAYSTFILCYIHGKRLEKYKGIKGKEAKPKLLSSNGIRINFSNLETIDKLISALNKMKEEKCQISETPCSV